MLRASTSRQPLREAWTEECLFRECSIVLGFAIETSTSAAYDSHLNSYITFCQLHHRPIDPTPDTLSYYVIWLAHHIEPRSVDNYLSGIANRLKMLFPDVRNARRSPLVSQTLQGCKRRLSKPVKQKLPLGVDDLARIAERIVQQREPDYDNKLFQAMLLTRFRSLQHLGESTWSDSHKLQSYKKVALRHTFSSNTESFRYCLPYQKNDSLSTGSQIIVFVDPNHLIDPVSHVMRYLAAHNSLFLHHPALWVTSTGVVPMCAWFLRCLHDLGGTEFSGHLLRVGGTTALAACGMALELI
ncbi:hypothetical protein C8R48DRAFT_596260 [Suillus tomentosus]|nr:hypothetical protein C8R48DRAFT_596260 [Suillus tomentosus]